MEQAESDLVAAEKLSALDMHSQAIWLAAQAIEKGHKAILVAVGLQFDDGHFKKFGHKTKELAAILPSTLQEPFDPAIADALANLEKRANDSRYPVGKIAPARRFTDSATEIADARRLMEWCRERVERASRAAMAMKSVDATATTAAPPAGTA